MDLKTIQLFARYNQTVNQEMNRILSGLSLDQWDHGFSGYFNSIHSVCNHIYICDFNWMKRFSGLKNFRFIRKELFSQDIGFDRTAVKDIRDYTGKREELDHEISLFAEEIKAGDLTKPLTYIDSHGKEYTRNFGGAVIHMFNHETHHRGMISIYLEELGIQNDYSNLVKIV